MHISVSIPGYENIDLKDKVSNVVEPFIMDFVKNAKGSVSAEHGIGF